MESQSDAHENSDGASQDEQIRRRTDEYARDLELNSWRQAEIHVTTAGFWGNFQWIFGGAATVLAAAASAMAFSHYALAAGILALCATGSAAIVTALRPGDLSAQHLKSATEFNNLQNEARDLWEFRLERLNVYQSRDEIGRLGRLWNEIMSRSPRVPRRLFKVTDVRYGKKGMYYFPRPRNNK